MPAPGYVTKSAFADDHLRCSRGWVTALAKAGRLVMNDAGHVHVEQSLARIRESQGAPERSGMATQVFADARERREHYDAEKARMDFEERCGRLMVAERVVHAVAAAAQAVRSRLENLPDQLAPLLQAATDEHQVRAILAEHVEAALSELANGFNAAAIGADRAS